jgi:hypothetical protein
LTYPKPYLRLVEQGLFDLRPWHLMDAERAQERARGLARPYRQRQLFPFAYRQDNDDVACWSRDCPEGVVVIHDFASPGFEDEDAFDSFWDWFRSAIDETIDWD